MGKIGMVFKLQMGMGMGVKSLKCEERGMKKLFPHISTTDAAQPVRALFYDRTPTVRSS